MKLSDYRVPKKLKVGGLIYNVIFPYSFTEDTNYLGLHSYDELTIKLGIQHHGIKINSQCLYATFMHEIIHAVDHVYCARAIDNEDIIDRLANGLYQVIVDNNLFIGIDRIPKKIKIGGYEIKVVYPYDFCDIGSNATLTFPILEVRMAGGRSSDLLHLDIIDCIVAMLCDMYCIRMGNTQKGEDVISDEHVLNHFAHGLYQVMKDNNLEYIIRGK